MGTSIRAGSTLGCFTTFIVLEFSLISILRMPSATLIIAPRSSSLPQPSSIKANTEFPSEANFARQSLINLNTSFSLKR
ncbi:hypothetical protein ES703_65397 [subsurface metagenome]